MKDIEKAYWNHEVSKQLEIGNSTLRKWCIELEKNGYIFIKGASGSRAFTDHDIAALMLFKNLTRSKNHTLEQAAMTVIEKYNRNNENDRTPAVREGNMESILETLLERSEKQEEFNKLLLDKLARQEQYIKESIEKRDKQLMENLKLIQEQKEEKKKKKIINRIKSLFK